MVSDVARRLERIIDDCEKESIILLDSSVFNAGLNREFKQFDGDTSKIRKITKRNKHLRNVILGKRCFKASRSVHNELLEKRDELYQLMNGSQAVNGCMIDMKNALRSYENLINSVSEYVDFAQFFPEEKQEYIGKIIRKITIQSIPLIDRKIDENGNKLTPSYIDVSQVVGGYLLALKYGGEVINISRDIDIWNASLQIRRCRGFHTHIGSVYGYSCYLLPNRQNCNITRHVCVIGTEHKYRKLNI